MNESQPIDTADVAVPQPILTTPPKPTLRRLFYGDDGLRAGWSLLLFLLITAALGFAVTFLVKHFHLSPPQPKQKPGDPPRELPFLHSLIGECIGFCIFLIPAFVMSLVEKRPFRRYGFTARRALPDVLAGLFWGLLALSALVGTLFFTHHLAFDARLLNGSAIITFGLEWLLGFFVVGLSEEFTTRGYIQYTVSRGVAGIARTMNPTFRHSHAVGFWVSAFLFSVLLFMAGHLANPGETLPGILAVGLAGTTFAFSLYRTGSLWWAIGFHAAWDWAQSFLYGVPDSGTMVQGHLFATHPLGAPLLSGGTTGPEGSIFVLPTLLLVCAVIHFTLPRRQYFLTPDQSPTEGSLPGPLESLPLTAPQSSLHAVNSVYREE